jgi:4-amino-4-deoxy-L-arabinose transferase-like glycosyltransferase
MWASAQPGWVAPDEDYHWHYVEHLLVEKRIPDLDEPFATGELYQSVVLVNHGHYFPGPRAEYEGDPHELVTRMGGTREATGERPRQVLHPPLYHLGAVVVDRAVTNEPALVRLTAMRYFSAMLGAIGIWAAWLLASQVLSRTWQQLAAAALVATQPIVAFSASTMTNDVLALLALTLALTWCVRALRRPPRPADGLVLGALLGFAVLAKSTMSVAIPAAGLALLMAWWAFRIPFSRVARVAGAAALVFAAVTAWWFRISIPETHSVLGARVSVTSGPSAEGAVGTGMSMLQATSEWISRVYRGYWFNYLEYEVTQRDLWYYLPLAAGVVGLVTLIVTVASLRRTLRDPERPEPRQILLLVAAALMLVLPPLWFDTRAAMAGEAFTVVQGRFLAPAFPAVAVVFVLAVTHALRRIRVAGPAAIAAVVAVACVSYGHTWVRWCLERFYGPVDGDWIAAFERAAWDKPVWIGPGWFAALAVVAIVAAVSAFALTLSASLRERPQRQSAASPEREVLEPSLG